MRLKNPHNPYKLIAEFNISIVEDVQLLQIKDRMKQEVGVRIDDMLVVEGCESDDKLVLGGKDAFLNHFCTYFQFNICYSNEKNGAKAMNRYFNDSDRINGSIESFIVNMDKNN